MKEIATLPVVQDEEGNIDFAMEVALTALVNHLVQDKVIPEQEKNLGLEYLPDLAVKQQFKDACRAVVRSIKESVKRGLSDATGEFSD